MAVRVNIADSRELYLLTICVLHERFTDVGTSPRGPIYKISHDLSYYYLKLIVRSSYDSDLQRAKISLRNSLPADRVDFSSYAAFKQTIEQINFSQFLFGYDN